MFVYYYEVLEDSWKVGYYNPKGDFVTVKITDVETEAQCLIHYLNGGDWSSVPG